MRDDYRREIDYMRISLTDRCNLRCRYCMPDDIELVPMRELLSLEEIVVICEEAAKLGIRKIKVTGGEPLVRRGCVELVGMIKKVSGIEQVTMTTNGVALCDMAEQLKKNGLDAVNISLDTLKREKFKVITGYDKFEQVMGAIQKTCELKIPTKINTVLQKGMNEEEWEELILLAKKFPLDVRFIEMMPIGSGREFEPIYNENVLEKIKNKYPKIQLDHRVHGNGPAVYYTIPGFLGSIGFINPLHGKFCSSCNRIRLTSVGKIKPCLCFEDCVDIKQAVRYGNREDVKKQLQLAILKKPQQHNFEEKTAITESKKMVQIGG
ncbi:MAG: GTP 3',8-cyclase MoaA [Lachnospiraceae bacterium]